MKTTIVNDDFGNEIVNIDYEDGNFASMAKSVYDEMIARNEANTL